VRGRGVVWEWLVVREVIRHCCACDVLVACGAHGRRACGSRRGRTEAPLEPAPSNVLVIEQVAYVLPAHADTVRKGTCAVIVEWPRITDHGPIGGVIVHICWGGAVGLTSDQIECSHRGGPKVRVVR